MSLKDQLLKAGLVDKKKSRKLDAKMRKDEYRKKKGTKRSKEEKQEAQKTQAQIEHQKRVDELNRQRNIEQQEKEKALQLYHLISGNTVRYQKGNINYFFIDKATGNVERLKVYVETQMQLALGALGICKDLSGKSDYCLVNRTAVEKISQLAPDKVAMLHPKAYSLNEINDA